MSKEIETILTRHKRLAGQRSEWESHWQELAEVMLPRRADFTAEARPGNKRTAKLYDSTPMLARRGLSSAIAGLLRPKTSRWFKMRTKDEALNERDEVKAWLEAAEDILFKAIHDPKSRFIQRSGEVDDDLVTFGTGCLFIGESRDLSRLMFRSYHLKDIVPVENGDGDIDTLFVSMTLSARQAAQRYGEENLGEKTKELLKEPNAEPDKTVKFLHVIGPRYERDPRLRDNRNLPVLSQIIDVESEHMVAELGYFEFPFAVPRWDTASNELFGRSPGMLALPDANTLQAMGKTLLVAGQKEVDPPLMAASDSVSGTPKTFPGGITYFDASALEGLGGNFPIRPLSQGANIPLGREMQNDVREQIFAAFFRNVLNLPIDSPAMTATEVLERKDEFIRTIGPVFGRLEADYNTPVVDRSFRILMRAGAFPEAPDILDGSDVRFEYASPVEQARTQIESASFARHLELMAPLAAQQPEIWDNYDGDEIARDGPSVHGFPSRYVRPREDVEAARQARAQAQQAQALLDGAGQAASLAGTVQGLGAEPA